MRYLLISMLCLAFACGKSSADNNNNNGEERTIENTASKEEISTSEVASPTIYRTTVDELRLRAKPDSKSHVITKLPENQRLISLDEASENAFSVNLRGRKVTDVWRKVKLPIQKEGKDVVGWAFGGALKEELVHYEPLPDGRYERMYDQISAAEMSRIINMDLNVATALYSGRVSYRKTPTGLYLRDGQFEVVCTYNTVESPDVVYSATVMGAFVDGRLDGRVIRLEYGEEVERKGIVFFRNGNCEWGYMREEAEGILFISEQKTMGTCTFAYLEEGLVEQPYFEDNSGYFD